MTDRPDNWYDQQRWLDNLGAVRGGGNCPDAADNKELDDQ